MTKFLVDKSHNFSEGQMKNVTLGGKEVLVAKIDGGFYAIDNICSHAGAELNEGTLEANELTCPWHGAKWNIKTGDLIWFPQKLNKQDTYTVLVEDQNVYIEI